jgi:hypothetical protein
MIAYIAGGMRYETATKFTLGELEAIYKGNHRSRDASGAFCVTPPPEALGIVAAMKKADAVIAEIFKTSTGSGAGQAPKNTPLTQGSSLSGFEKLAEYARGKIA